MADNLSSIVGLEKTLVLSGRKFIVKSPTISDIAAANEYLFKKKKERKKGILIEKAEILKTLPQEMPYEEKMSFISELYPKPMTVEEKVKIMESFPKEMVEKEKIKRLIMLSGDRNDDNFDEYEQTLFLLWRIVSKKEKNISLEELKDLVSVEDLSEITKILNPDSESDENGIQVKNEQRENQKL